MPARNWALSLLDSHPEWTTVRLGHGYDDTTHETTVWVDVVTQDGWHLAADRNATLPTVPKDVQDTVKHQVPLGLWIEVQK